MDGTSLLFEPLVRALSRGGDSSARVVELDAPRLVLQTKPREAWAAIETFAGFGVTP